MLPRNIGIAPMDPHAPSRLHALGYTLAGVYNRSRGMVVTFGNWFGFYWGFLGVLGIFVLVGTLRTIAIGATIQYHMAP